MSHIRQAQKEKTRQALLAAALHHLEEQSLSSIGLREITRTVGIAPAGFYRHFRDMSDLGVALVDEALGGLHELVRETLATADGPEQRISRTVELITKHVRAHSAHIRFVSREQHGGVRAVRTAIAAQLGLFAQEVADTLRDEPDSAGWSEGEVRMLAELYVDHMVTTASALLSALDGEGRDAEEVARTARRQLELINVGHRHYRSET
ncbi:TetR family transcriptional regulator [Streptomyces armeniacus]|uniref:TetR family transcriptional regulator n=1 Tax=Streptomyces armeniacus TaxID=83291 RepID=A0A345XJH2_9ACTN|nr:TetR family transcriptional regulator [Streptomyces armeniacus]AXK31788.1 TetR family transcriptional regulator [Streptomyces armeniacus]